ncbi:IS3 family transposase [Streptomyces sp. NPDC005728]|uniref:IS3 family transposase n=1 Tax=Streptomyces sp. NPDC005728 TaxID=3157054 RepID=UPI0033C81090
MTVAGFIADQRTEHRVPHTIACRALEVSESWFYKWRQRPERPTKREVRRAALAERITYFFNASGRTYGSPRITLDLWAEGWQVPVNTVAQIMAELGLQGRKPPRRRRNLTRPGKRKTARSTIKVEYIHRHRFTTRAEARLKIATWIADFYNTRRRHSAAGGLPPVEFERTITTARSRSHQEAQAA